MTVWLRIARVELLELVQATCRAGRPEGPNRNSGCVTLARSLRPVSPRAAVRDATATILRLTVKASPLTFAQCILRIAPRGAHSRGAAGAVETRDAHPQEKPSVADLRRRLLPTQL
jgi:hypothetical protein